MTCTTGAVCFGGFCFGSVIGWVTREVMVRADKLAISHIAAVVAAVGGAGVTKLFGTELPFAAYCIGLALSFFTFILLHDIDPVTGRVIPKNERDNVGNVPLSTIFRLSFSNGECRMARTVKPGHHPSE